MTNKMTLEENYNATGYTVLDMTTCGTAILVNGRLVRFGIGGCCSVSEKDLSFGEAMSRRSTLDCKPSGQVTSTGTAKNKVWHWGGKDFSSCRKAIKAMVASVREEAGVN